MPQDLSGPVHEDQVDVETTVRSGSEVFSEDHEDLIFELLAGL